MTKVSTRPTESKSHDLIAMDFRLACIRATAVVPRKNMKKLFPTIFLGLGRTVREK